MRRMRPAQRFRCVILLGQNHDDRTESGGLRLVRVLRQAGLHGADRAPGVSQATDVAPGAFRLQIAPPVPIRLGKVGQISLDFTLNGRIRS